MLKNAYAKKKRGLFAREDWGPNTKLCTVHGSWPMRFPGGWGCTRGHELSKGEEDSS